ncbi:hypothetical protein JQN58_04785 [Aneurinibacillus sp. BA2021]|nr:hypothetical protein [Aneurinibacillus sp. BA2021]
MAYKKQVWKDEIPDLTKPIKDASGKQKTDPQTGRPLYELVQEGTRITSTRLNYMETGIEGAHALIEQLGKELGGNFVSDGLQFSASGLTASWTAGIGYVGGRRFDIAAGSIPLNPTQGQYIYLDADGAVKKTTSQSVADAALPLWYFSTDASKVIVSTDRRRIISPDTFAKKEDVDTKLAQKVDKEAGKGLSTNDYTDAEKQKVAGAASQASLNAHTGDKAVHITESERTAWNEAKSAADNHETRLQPIESQLNEAASVPVTLKPGLNTITCDRTTPFNVLNIKGRTLINLLGRLGRTATSATITTDAAKRYLIINEGGNSVTVNGTSRSTPYKVTGVTSLALSWTAENKVAVYDITADVTVDTLTNAQIAAKYAYVDDAKPVRNPYLIRYAADGTTIEDYAFYDVCLHSNTAGTLQDELFYRDGTPWKLQNFREVILDGSLPWEFAYDGVGCKRMHVPAYFKDWVGRNSSMVVKHDGKILSYNGLGATADTFIDYWDGSAFPHGTLAIVISDAESGWYEGWTGNIVAKSPNYTLLTRDATGVEMIKAFFNGWKWYEDSTGGGAGGWRPINDPNAAKTWDVDRVIREYAPGHTPYRLILQQAQSTQVPVTYEGAISLQAGNNTLEIGTGVVIREAAPLAVNNNIAIGMGDSNFPSKYRLEKFLFAYKNGTLDRLWYASTNSPYGKEKARLDWVNYDSSANYSMTYLVLDRHAFTAPLTTLQGEYATTVAGVLALQSKGTADVEARVSVTEMELSTTRMLLDKILRGEISVGLDWGKQKFRPFSIRPVINNTTGTTTVTVLKVEGRGYLHGFHVSMNNLINRLYVGLYVDGEKWFDESQPSGYEMNSSDSGRSYPYLIKFEKGFEIRLQNIIQSSSYQYAVDGVYSLEN